MGIHGGGQLWGSSAQGRSLRPWSPHPRRCGTYVGMAVEWEAKGGRAKTAQNRSLFFVIPYLWTLDDHRIIVFTLLLQLACRQLLIVECPKSESLWLRLHWMATHSYRVAKFHCPVHWFLQCARATIHLLIELMGCFTKWLTFLKRFVV